MISKIMAIKAMVDELDEMLNNDILSFEYTLLHGRIIVHISEGKILRLIKQKNYIIKDMYENGAYKLVPIKDSGYYFNKDSDYYHLTFFLEDGIELVSILSKETKEELM